MDKDLIEEKLEQHEKRLDKHEGKIDVLEKDNTTNTTKITDLCKSLDNLTSTMKWFIGTWVTTLLGFFIFVIEKIFFKY
jgi:hypothetical protein